MKKLHIQKNKIKISEAPVEQGDMVKISGEPYDVNLINKSAGVVIMHKRNARAFIIFHMNSKGALVEYIDQNVNSRISIAMGNAYANALIVRDNRLIQVKQSETPVDVPVTVGDEISRDNRTLKVVFVAEDGSLVAWDAERKTSVYINRNDRDQIKAYGLKLAEVKNA